MKQIGMIAVLIAVFTSSAFAQCATWVGLSNEGEILDAHSLYRDNYKMARKSDGTFDLERLKGALPYWTKVFEVAPAADGKRDWHYANGVDIYMELFKAETDATKKDEYKQKVLDLYDGWVQCIESGAIIVSNTSKEEYIGYIRGREAFNMYYTLNVPYEDNIASLEEAIDKAGNKSEYIVFDPYARIVVYQFTNELMDKEMARDVHKKLNDIADHNIENNQQFGSYYKTAKESMNAVFAQIENYIFDCDYFKEKLLPEHEADPKNGELLRSIISTLKQRGCTDEDPTMADLNAKYKSYADSVNAILQAEQYAKFPHIHARALYKEEKWDEAIGKWEEAMEKAEEEDKAAEYNYWIGYTKFFKKDQVGGALANARKGMSSSEYGGKATMLVGDIYAKLSRSCGDPAWEQRLAVIAVIDKYASAKAKDPSISDEANRKIGIYNASLPERQAGFMRKVSEGQSVSLSCLGESVKVRFID